MASSLLFAVLLTAANPGTDFTPLPSSFWDKWLEEVHLLMGPRERTAFESLETDSSRFEFRREFWRARDPEPHTAQNEWRDQWDERARYAREEFGDLSHHGAQF